MPILVGSTCWVHTCDGWQCLRDPRPTDSPEVSCPAPCGSHRKVLISIPPWNKGFRKALGSRDCWLWVAHLHHFPLSVQWCVCSVNARCSPQTQGPRNIARLEVLLKVMLCTSIVGQNFCWDKHSTSPILASATGHIIKKKTAHINLTSAMAQPLPTLLLPLPHWRMFLVDLVFYFLVVCEGLHWWFWGILR